MITGQPADPESGAVELVRFTTVDDCGRAVSPMILHGQTHGGGEGGTPPLPG